MTNRDRERKNRTTELQRCFDMATANIERLNNELSHLRNQAIKTKNELEKWNDLLQKVKDRAEEQGVLHIL